jgi:hypothetical protein
MFLKDNVIPPLPRLRDIGEELLWQFEHRSTDHLISEG